MSAGKKRIGCVVVAHGRVAECLMEAVQGILGTQSNWVAVSNAGMGLGDLMASVESAVNELSEDCDVVVMSDMPGGSCHHVCQELAVARPDVRILTGLNLMMLLEFFVKRDRVEVDDLLSLVKERGRDAVRIV